VGGFGRIPEPSITNTILESSVGLQPHSGFRAVEPWIPEPSRLNRGPAGPGAF